MKTTYTNESYITPSAEVVEIKNNGIICSSLENFDRDDSSENWFNN